MQESKQEVKQVVSLVRKAAHLPRYSSLFIISYISYFSEKIGFGVSCESSRMKSQMLFLSKK